MDESMTELEIAKARIIEEQSLRLMSIKNAMDWRRRCHEIEDRYSATVTSLRAVTLVAGQFVDKIKALEPAINGAFAIAHVHGSKYDGPNYCKEMAELLAVIIEARNLIARLNGVEGESRPQMGETERRAGA